MGDIFDPEDTLLEMQDTKFKYERARAANGTVTERRANTMGVGLQTDSIAAHRQFHIEAAQQRLQEAHMVTRAKAYASTVSRRADVKKLVRQIAKEDSNFLQHPHAAPVPLPPEPEAETSEPDSPPADQPSTSAVVPKRVAPKPVFGFGSSTARKIAPPPPATQARPKALKQTVAPSEPLPPSSASADTAAEPSSGHANVWDPHNTALPFAPLHKPGYEGQSRTWHASKPTPITAAVTDHEPALVGPDIGQSSPTWRALKPTLLQPLQQMQAMQASSSQHPRCHGPTPLPGSHQNSPLHHVSSQPQLGALGMMNPKLSRSWGGATVRSSDVSVGQLGAGPWDVSVGQLGAGPRDVSVGQLVLDGSGSNGDVGRQGGGQRGGALVAGSPHWPARGPMRPMGAWAHASGPLPTTHATHAFDVHADPLAATASAHALDMRRAAVGAVAPTAVPGRLLPVLPPLTQSQPCSPMHASLAASHAAAGSVQHLRIWQKLRPRRAHSSSELQEPIDSSCIPMQPSNDSIAHAVPKHDLPNPAHQGALDAQARMRGTRHGSMPELPHNSQPYAYNGSGLVRGGDCVQGIETVGSSERCDGSESDSESEDGEGSLTEAHLHAAMQQAGSGSKSMYRHGVASFRSRSRNAHSGLQGADSAGGQLAAAGQLGTLQGVRVSRTDA